MENKKVYWFWDIANITLFFSILICFITVTIISIVGLINAPSSSEIAGVLTKNDYWIQILQRGSMIFVMFLPALVRKIFKLNLPHSFTMTFYVFMFLSAFLGTFINLYEIFPFWDKIIHFISGILFGLLSIFILNAFISPEMSLRKRTLFTIIFIICFSMAIAVFWEIFEFALDGILGLNCQKFMDFDGIVKIGRDALKDSMFDCISVLAGAVVASLVVPIGNKYDKNFLNEFTIYKIKNEQDEVEQIEE